jgi:hypothetical protein
MLRYHRHCTQHPLILTIVIVLAGNTEGIAWTTALTGLASLGVGEGVLYGNADLYLVLFFLMDRRHAQGGDLAFYFLYCCHFFLTATVITFYPYSLPIR